MSAELRWAAVLGKPIAHSLSPLLHRAAYRVLRLPWGYRAVEVSAEDLPAFLLNSDPLCAGYSLTMPLKDVAYEIAIEPDDAARRTRAVNTLIPTEWGWRGYNTDVPGLAAAIDRAGWKPESVLILGAGATARSAGAACALLGVNRTFVSARRNLAAIDLATELGAPRSAASSLNEPLPSAELVISTLPAGAADQVRLHPDSKYVFDVVYAPWPSRLAEQAHRMGAEVRGGLDMLVEQAVLQVGLMTGCAESELPEVRTAMYDVAARAQASRS